MGRPNVNWTIGNATEKHSTYTSKTIKAGIPFVQQVTEPDMKYIIKYDFDLKEAAVEMPKNCILEFDGGSISNGTIQGSNTEIISPNVQIFHSTSLEGTFINEFFYADWFVDNPDHADEGINNAVLSAYKTGVSEVKLMQEIYCINNPIQLFNKSRLIGRDGEMRTPSRGSYKDICGGTTIYVTSNVNGIEVHSYPGDGDHLNSVCIRNILLDYNPSNTKTVTYNNSIKTNYGVYISNHNSDGTVRRSTFRNSSFERFAVLNFRYGIYIRNTDYYPSGSCTWNNVYCCYNHVGVKIEGIGNVNGTVQERTNRVWTNCFNMNVCSFSSNYLGGFWTHNIPQIELVCFNACVFEGNGDNYNLNMVNDPVENPLTQFGKKVGAYAVRTEFEGNRDAYGQLIFSECYFEWNYYKRTASTGSPSSSEFAYSNNTLISPKDVFLNNYMIYSVKQDIVVRNCRINYQPNYAYVHVAGLIFEDNYCTYDLGQLMNVVGVDRNDCLITFNANTSRWFHRIVVKDIFSYRVARENSQLKYVTSYLKVENFTAYFFERSSDKQTFDIDVPFETPFYLKQDHINAEFFVNPNRTVGGIGAIFCKAIDMSEVDRVLNSIEQSPETFKINVPLTYQEGGEVSNNYFQKWTSVEVTHKCGYYIVAEDWPADYFTDDNGLLYPTEAIQRATEDPGYAEYPNELPKLIKSATRIGKTVMWNSVFEALKLVVQGAENDCMMHISGGDTVEFINCIIWDNSASVPFIKTDIDNLTIIFRNCSFHSVANRKMVITDNPHNNVILEHCNTYEDTLLVSYSRRGTSADRPAFGQYHPSGYEYFDETLGKPIYWLVNNTYPSGTWVDATGNEIDTETT